MLSTDTIYDDSMQLLTTTNDLVALSNFTGHVFSICAMCLLGVEPEKQASAQFWSFVLLSGVMLSIKSWSVICSLLSVIFDKVL